jgi:hypothetical protein
MELYIHLFRTRSIMRHLRLGTWGYRSHVFREVVEDAVFLDGKLQHIASLGVGAGCKLEGVRDNFLDLQDTFEKIYINDRRGKGGSWSGLGVEWSRDGWCPSETSELFSVLET